MSSWKEYKIGQIVSLEYGKGLRDYRNGDGLYDVFGTNGQIGKTNSFLFDHPSVIIGRKGAYRGVHLAKRPSYVIDTAFYTKNKIDELDTIFLYYWFKNVDINDMDSGSAIPSTSRDEVYELEIELPPLSEQKAIASILGSLDDKIDLLHRQNATLEAMAETLFRQWFVEEAKEEWGEGNIYEFVEVVYGYPFKSELFNKAAKGLPLIRIRDLRNGRSDVYTDEECDEKYRISTGDLLAGMDGEFKLYIWSGGESLLNQRVCKFLPKHDFVPHLYVFGLMKPHLHYYEKTKVGTTVIHLGKSDLDEIRISIPDEQVLRAFGDVTNPIFDKLKNNFTQIRTLVALRDMLLPKLMCGEIRLDGVLMEMSNIVRQSNM